jgi:hypothetical protein
VDFYAIKILHTILVFILLLNSDVHEQFQDFPTSVPLHASLTLVISAAVFFLFFILAPAKNYGHCFGDNG